MRMSKEEVFNLIKKRTLDKLVDGKQIKLTGQEILEELKVNEATLYKNLNGIRTWDGVKTEKCIVIRYKEGRKIKFNQTYWWISD